MSLIHKLAEPPCDMEYIRLRCRESEGCWLWAGAAKKGSRDGPEKKGRWPVLILTRTGMDGIKREFVLYVRQIVYWIKAGKRPSFKGGKTLGSTCHDSLCVSPSHIRMTTYSEVQKRRQVQLSAADRARIAATKRKTSKLSDDAVTDIRGSESSRRELAEKYGITPEYVRQLQHRECRRDYSNPFSGLGA